MPDAMQRNATQCSARVRREEEEEGRRGGGGGRTCACATTWQQQVRSLTKDNDDENAFSFATEKLPVQKRFNYCVCVCTSFRKSLLHPLANGVQ